MSAINARDRNLIGTGFIKEVFRKHLGKCPFCNKDVSIEDFKDAESRKEFEISGLCQECQTKMFG